jgi:hypothetical protein
MFKLFFKTLDVLHSEMRLALLNCGPTKVLISDLNSATGIPRLQFYDVSKCANVDACQT